MAEKSLTEMPVALRELFDKGKAALHKGNYDYAIALFTDVLNKEPGFVACREALRKTQIEKKGQKKSLIKKFLGKASPLLAKAQVQLKSSPREAMSTIEQLLSSDPYNAGAQKVLADAALVMEFPQTEALAREIAFNENPTDRDNALKLADSLLRVGRSDKGRRIMEALTKAFPDDAKLISAYNTWSAKRTLNESLSGGEVETYREMLEDEKETVTLEQLAREVKDPEVAQKLAKEFVAELENDPENQSIMQRIGDLYEKAQNYELAIEYYNKVNDLRGGDDPSLSKMVTRSRMASIDLEISQLDPNSSEFEEIKNKLESQKQTIAITDCEKRINKHPNDLELRFEMGVHYFNGKKIGDAIKQFQRSQDHPAHKITSLKYLGICFASRRLYDMAASAFERALSEKELFDDEKKELHYEFGVVLLKMNERDKSIEQFKKIYEKDLGYRDVEQKVEDFYASSD